MTQAKEARQMAYSQFGSNGRLHRAFDPVGRETVMQRQAARTQQQQMQQDQQPQPTDSKESESEQLK